METESPRYKIEAADRLKLWWSVGLKGEIEPIRNGQKIAGIAYADLHLSRPR